MLTQDDWYEGHFLPKNTIFIANTWSIHHDDSQYENPEQFIPERWLDNEFGTKHAVAAAAGDAADNDHRRTTYVFGAGRRVCPGQQMGQISLVSARIVVLLPLGNILIIDLMV
jgi:cytochrome P450